MDGDDVETTSSSFRPIDRRGLLCSPLVASPISPAPEQDDDSDSPSSSDDDEGRLGDYVQHAADEWEEGGFSNDEQVASDHYSWKIDHTKGDHKLRVQNFVAATKRASFDGNQAIDMLQKRFTLDFGSQKAGSRATVTDDELFCSFSLDLLIIIGRPLRPITKPSSRFFDNITISFKNWRASYSAKHAHGISFDLEHRTFRIATAATRESWFIVMHPVTNAPEELLSRAEHRKRREKSSESSALELHRAQFLASYIKEVFLIGELLGEGVEPSWRLDGPHTQKITVNKWTIFQETFMREWPEYVRHNTRDLFWTENHPAFHAYDYGANIEIEVTEQLQAVPKETRLRTTDEDSESDEESVDVETSSVGHEEQQDEDRDGEEPGSSAAQYNYKTLFTGGLQQLRTELEEKYVIGNLESVSYALAVDINCLDGRSPDPNDKLARCLLADRNAILGEYRAARDFTFFPLAFHPAYGNFSSPRPPAFLTDNLLAVLQDNMSYQHNGASVLHCGHFQAYSNVKRSFRHGPDDLLVTKGVATAALALPNRDGSLSARVVARRERLLQQLQGQLSPSDPASSKPFFREGQRIGQAIEEEEFAFRMEQVLSVQVSRLRENNRQFTTALSPIFQLIRFFVRESQQYTHLFRSFRPCVFPGVLASYATLFGQAIESIHARFEAAGSKGLPVALAEGVSALDRLGSYCFTGCPRSLMGAVLAPLGTMDSIEQGAWPFIDPVMLDLQGAGSLNLAKWPRRENGRPILLHIASIGFHYGPEVAAHCRSELWFNELGGLRVQGLSSATQFVTEVLEELWKPQMIAFVTHHCHRALNRGRTGQEVSGGQGALQLLEDQRTRLRQWAEAEHPFTWTEYESILSLVQEGTKSATSTQRTRRDFANDLYDQCLRHDRAAGRSFCSHNATWFSVLRAAVRYIGKKAMSKDQWIGALTVGMLACQIECMPGSYHSKLSWRRVVRLVGSAPTLSVIAARPGSLKHAAIEAENKISRSLRGSRSIDLGCEVPFTSIPQIIEEGFQEQEKTFLKGNRAILEHYQTARQCLAECLGNPLCDVMLLLVLTLASSSETPAIPPHTHAFGVGPRKKPSMFAANLVTRMLWFLRPSYFPWDADAGTVLRIPEMTKKVEHKGVNNRLLRELGWIKVVKGKRDSPRNSEVTLQDEDVLLQRRRELLSRRKDAAGFLSLVFHSYDAIWTERCASIVVEG